MVLAEAAARISVGRSCSFAAKHGRRLSRCCSADGLDDLLASARAHLGFRLQGHVADLVEEQRPAVRQFELPRRSATAPVKAPFMWPNSSLLDQFLGDGGTIQLDEGALPTPAQPGICRATSSLPCRSRRKSGHGRWFAPPSRSARAAGPWRSSPRPLSALSTVARRRGFSLPPAPLADRIGRSPARSSPAERLLDEVVSTELDRADGGLDVAVPRNHHHGESDPRCRSFSSVTSVHAGSQFVQPR